MAEETKPRFRHWLEYAGLSSAAWIIRHLPYDSLRRLAAVSGALMYLVDKHRREVSLANLEAAFGDTLSLKEKKRIARQSFATFARTMLELFWSPNLTQQKLDELTTTEGLDQPAITDPDRPVILICLHASNFEWLSQDTTYRIGNGIVVAQKLKNPLLGPIFDRMRSSTGHTIIPQERAMLRMLKHLKKGGYFNMVVDLNLDPREPSVIIDQFGGLKTCVTQMHAALAGRSGARIIPAECIPLPDGGYRLIYHPALEVPEGSSAQTVAQMCWDVLEPGIRRRPELWLWSYKHWRFRPSGDCSGRYPFYSNIAKRFDRLLKVSNSRG